MTRRVITFLLLAWTLGLGLVQAGVRPAYELRAVAIAGDDCGAADCAGDDGAAPAGNCVAVCLAWCMPNGFAALSEGDGARLAPDTTVRAFELEHFRGAVRRPRPLLPPPRD